MPVRRSSPCAIRAVVFGYYGGNLSNGGERIAILDANGSTVIAVHYDDEAGWPRHPTAADIRSKSLIRAATPVRPRTGARVPR
jgi:hypothetical protein